MVFFLDARTGKKTERNGLYFFPNSYPALGLTLTFGSKINFYEMKQLIVVIGLLFVFGLPTKIFAQDSHKRIEIDLTRQQLFAYEGTQLKYSFLVSSGKWFPTPVGDFKPYAKLLSTEMIGGNPLIGTYYDLPNVPYVVYFYQGYALHGTYWHNNFGHPMSHGCVNLRTPDMALLYNWVDYSTTIHIFGVTPQS